MDAHELDTDAQIAQAEQDLWDYPLLCDKVEASRPGGSASIVWWSPRTNEPSSPVERHVIRVEDALNTIAAVNRLLRRLHRQERQLVRLRYFERQEWPTVARRMHISQRNAARWRIRILQLYLTIR